MNLFDFLFYLISAIILVSAAAASFSLKVKTAFLCNLLALIAATSIYLFLNLDYLALLHLFIYTIAVSLVILFAAANCGQLDSIEVQKSRLTSVVTVSLFSALTAGNLVSTKWKEIPLRSDTLPSLEITRLLQMEYLLPLFLLAMILTVVITGNSYIIRKEG
jgi:NADH-quinone oxidoreductase subunit J